MATVLKKATGLTGMAVSQNPKYTLNRIYKRILGILSKMPESAAYKKHTEEVIKFRTSVVNSTDEVAVMEKNIGCGQIEEVIIQAKNELELAEMMLLTRPWESLITPVPQNQWKWPMK